MEEIKISEKLTREYFYKWFKETTGKEISFGGLTQKMRDVLWLIYLHGYNCGMEDLIKQQNGEKLFDFPEEAK